MGTIHVTYGTPTKYEITLYRVTVTAAGVGEGWTVASLTDEALGFGGLSLAECPRAIVDHPAAAVHVLGQTRSGSTIWPLDRPAPTAHTGPLRALERTPDAADTPT